MKKNACSFLLGGLISLGLVASAQAEGWYAGASVGGAHVKDDAPDNGRSINRDSSSTGYKLFTGYQINPQLAVEAAYADLGKETFNWRYGKNESGAGSIKLQSLSVAVVGSMPIADGIRAFGKLGAAQMQGKYHESWSQPGYAETIDIKKSKTVANYGLGLAYQIMPKLEVRAELEGYGKVKVEDLGIKSRLLSVGIGYQF